MEFIPNDFQKKLLVNIYEKKISNVQEFIDQMIELRPQKYTRQNTTIVNGVTFSPNEEYIGPLDRDDLIRKLSYYVEVFNFGKRNGILNASPLDRSIIKYKKLPIFFPVPGESIDSRVLNLIEECIYQGVYPTEALNQFISSDFKTPEWQRIEKEENEKHNEKERVIKAEKRSLNISIAAVVVSVVISLLGIAFQYFTYQNERIITIKSPDFKHDTLKVIEINSHRDQKLEMLE